MRGGPEKHSLSSWSPFYNNVYTQSIHRNTIKTTFKVQYYIIHNTYDAAVVTLNCIFMVHNLNRLIPTFGHC